jgi:hypothetical protein
MEVYVTTQHAGRVVGLVVSEHDLDEAQVEKTLAPTGAHVVFISGMLSRFNDVVNVLAPVGVPSPAWLEQARRNAEERRRFLDEFGALDSEEVATLARSKSANRRSLAQRWRSERRIFGVEIQGRYVYPGFQFDPESGQPKPVIARILKSLPGPLRDGGWQLALWWDNAVDTLEFRRPVDIVDEDPEAVVSAARAEAAEWAQAGAI